MNKFFLILTLLMLKDCSNRTSNGMMEKGWRDFSGLDLKMKGVVYYVNNDVSDNYFHGRGIARIRIISSNISFYDPRDKQKNYYCLIKGGKAELYDNNVNETAIGDTIEIDTNEQLIKWLNKDKKDQMFSLSIGEVSFFDYIKKNGLQEFDKF